MKKAIPVICAIVLIIVIGAVAFGSQIIEKYSYSDEMADLYEYFNLISEDEAAVVLQDELVEEKAVIADGICYFDLETVHKYFDDRFYIDEVEGLLLYTTPTDIIRTAVGSSVYAVNGAETDAGYRLSFARTAGEGTAYYIAADYVKQYADFTYELFTAPNRIQVYTEWAEVKTAEVQKNNAVRNRGGVKSPILTKVSAGDTVTVLEEMETWSKVKTQDAYIGYIENKILTNAAAAQREPGAAFAQKPEYTSLTRDHKISLGWHSVYSTAGNDTMASLVANTKGMNVIAPTWFSLSDNEGGFESFAQASYVEKAHGMGLEVWGVVDDFNYKSNHEADISVAKVLASTTTRTSLINGLVEAAQNCGMDGINVDFEQITADCGEDYVQFLRELSIQCRKNGIVLSVDNPVPFNFNSFFDIEEQGVVADYVIIMGYDEHGGSSTEAGPVASLGYVQQGLENATAAVPSNKIINALPFYTRLWKTVGAEVTSKAYAMTAVSGLLSEYGMTAEWDEETNSNYASVVSGDATYQIWIEDTQSILAKINVMQTYNLGGVAAWRLGFEPAAVWDILSAYVQQ